MVGSVRMGVGPGARADGHRCRLKAGRGRFFFTQPGPRHLELKDPEKSGSSNPLKPDILAADIVRNRPPRAVSPQGQGYPNLLSIPVYFHVKNEV